MFREGADVFSARVRTEAILRPTGHSPVARAAGRCGATLLVALLMSFGVPLLRAADCISIQETRQHIGETKCVSGKVVRVKAGVKGVHFIDFCEDPMACPFTVVVFASDLKDVGDVRRLGGRTIEIRGEIQLYEGHAEIILRRISQIAGGAAMIPPLPKAYDVETRGRFSAGRLYPSKKPKKARATPNISATYDVEGEEP